MATQKKINQVETYTKKFQDAKSIFLADFRGIDVAMVTELRKQFRDAGVEYRVIKNTLAKRSFANAGITGLDDQLVGPTAFAYSNTSATLPIKVIQEFNKKNEKNKITLSVKGCLFEGKVFPPEQAQALASLPTREELIAQLLGALQSPLGQVLSLLQASSQKLLGALWAVKNLKSK
jgi:large subunit ribosomal protein L10